MRLVKENNHEYWVNYKGQRHGEFKRWWDNNGELREQCFWVNDKLHGECKWWFSNGELIDHEYWCHGKRVRDLIIEPVTEEDKFMLTLEHGGKWLCD